MTIAYILYPYSHRSQGILMLVMIMAVIILCQGASGQTYLTSYLPACRNGGTRIYADGRSSCKCESQVQTGPLCEITRINFENLPRPLTIVDNVSLSLPFLISMDFVNNDYRGTGQLFSLQNELMVPWFQLSLFRGQLRVTSSDFASTISSISLSNNKWHHLDFVLTAKNGQLELFVIIDKCAQRYRCSQQLSLGAIKPGVIVTGFLTVGGPTAQGDRLINMCMENIILDSQLVDLTASTAHQLALRGCPKCEEACYNIANNSPKCGLYGICRNPLTLTEDYTCMCKAGHQADLPVNSWQTTSAPCNKEADVWHTTSNYITLQLPVEPIFAYQFSVRTRAKDFLVFKLGQGLIDIYMKGGIPVVTMGGTTLSIDAVDVSDGLWHTFYVGLTLCSSDNAFALLDFSVDEMWGTFYKYKLVYPSFDVGTKSVMLLNGANSSCLTDLLVEVLAAPKSGTFYQKPILGLGDPVNLPGLSRGCQTGQNPCFTTGNGNACGENQICLPEWRGHKCICADDYSLRDTPSGPQCILTSCTLNPCQNGGICVPIDTVVTWSNQSIGVRCQCQSGWIGVFCENAFKTAQIAQPPWWMLPFFLVLGVTLLAAIIGFCWYYRRYRIAKMVHFRKGVSVAGCPEKLNLNDTFKAGEKVYRGPMKILNVGEASDCKADVNEVPISGYLNHNGEEMFSNMTETFQPSFYCRDDRYHSMDQPLQYAFEGYDSSPPPTYFMSFEYPSERR